MSQRAGARIYLTVPDYAEDRVSVMDRHCATRRRSPHSLSRCRHEASRPSWTADDGWPRSYTWALKKVKRAARIASERHEARGLPALPSVRPHTLRHTYFSILLLVTDNVPYVMEQVGHDDESTTTRIYRHLIRQRQEHGAAFDRTVAQAREGFGATAEAKGFMASIWPGSEKSADAPGGARA